MSAIFISYRRDDSAGYAGRLFDKLVQHFDRERLFMDIENLEYGEDFVEAIDRAIASCAGLIVVIGPDWLDARDAQGRRRLEDPHDFIHLEIAAALKRDIRVIPVLVHGAEMPREADLPEALQPLARRQATELSDNRWDYDVGRLAEALESLLGPGPLPPPNRSWVWVLAAIVVVAGGLAWVLRQAPEVLVTGMPQTAEQPSKDQSGTVETPMPPKEAGVVEPSPLEPAAITDKTPAPATDEVPPAAASPPPSVSPVKPVPEPVVPTSVPPVAGPAAEPPGVNGVGEKKEPDLTPDSSAQRIAELLAEAEADFRALRLTSPAGRNALARYRQVLALDPDNPTAQAGVRRIGERYRQWAEGALRTRDLPKARRYVAAGASVDSQLPWLERVRSGIRRLAQQPPPRMPPAPAPPRRDCEDRCASQQTACTEVARRNKDPGACKAQAKSRCKDEYKACKNDGSKAFMWGPVAHESECRQAEALCLRESEGICEQGLGDALTACENQAAQCRAGCSN